MSESSRREPSQSSRKVQLRHHADISTKKAKRAARSVGTTPRAELLSRFGARVRTCRDAAKLTQDKLGAAASMTQPYVAAIEAGAINPTLETMANIAAALGVAIRDLV